MSGEQPFHFDKPFVVLSDWDGTITTCDSNDHLTDNYGMGPSGRVALNLAILEFDESGNGVSFKDAFGRMLDSVSANGHSLEDCKRYLTTPTVGPDGRARRPVELTNGFLDFKKFCDAHEIPFTIVSSGMDELIRAVLTELAQGPDADVVRDISIVSNGVGHDHAGRWFIRWRHPDSAYGHDKSRAILPYREYRRAHDGRGPTVFFFGDGVSDLSAAQHADVLFVKVTGSEERDGLRAHCDRTGIPYVPFAQFDVAQAIVEQIVRGEKTKDDFLVRPTREE